MKELVGSEFIVLATLLSAPQSASASTYESYHCGCTAPSEESCSCNYGYTLGKLAIKEFRGYCDNDYIAVNVHSLNKGNTCTVEFWWDDCESRSCTNWSLTRSDSIDVEVVCTNSDPISAAD